ncbi:hypothetical protein [Aeromonas phage AerS_266]|nr:hypothetical protein [Aeromonas phage AerS_266]
MSIKAQRNADKKRAARRIASTAKKKNANRNQVSVKPVKSKTFNKTLENIRTSLDNNRVDSLIKHSGGVNKEKLSKINTDELINSTRSAIGDCFKLFCYVSLAVKLGEQNKINYQPSIDIEDIARSMMNIDKTFSTFKALRESDPENFVINVFDVGSELETRATELYEEISKIDDEHGIAIASYVTGSAKEYMIEHPEVTMDEARIAITEAVAYTVLEQASVKQELMDNV